MIVGLSASYLDQRNKRVMGKSTEFRAKVRPFKILHMMLIKSNVKVFKIGRIRCLKWINDFGWCLGRMIHHVKHHGGRQRHEHHQQSDKQVVIQ